MVDYVRLARDVVDAEEQVELARVDDLAQQLLHHLKAEAPEIAKLHIHGAPSMAIQVRVGQLLESRLGFGSEVLLTPDDGFVTRARPDFFFPLSEASGVIAEVERGGTTANNHDLKDLWKTHIAVNAKHLFLIVPQELFNESGAVRERPFPKVARRMGAFFTSPRTHVDVLGVHVFGY